MGKKTDEQIIEEARALYVNGDLAGASLKLMKIAGKGNPEACYLISQVHLENAEKRTKEKEREIYTKSAKIFLEKAVAAGHKEAIALMENRFGGSNGEAKVDTQISNTPANIGSTSKRDAILEIIENLNAPLKLEAIKSDQTGTVEKFIQNHNLGISLSDVIAYCDTAVFSSGKKGHLLTEEFLYFSANGKRGTKVELSGLVSAEKFNYTKLQVIYTNGERKVYNQMEYSTTTEYYVDLLNALVAIENKTEEKTESKEQVPVDIEEAVILMNAGQHDEAISILEKYAREGNLTAVYYLACATAETGKYSTALKYANLVKDGNADDELKQNANELIEEIQAKIEQEKKEKAEAEAREKAEAEEQARIEAERLRAEEEAREKAEAEELKRLEEEKAKAEAAIAELEKPAPDSTEKVLDEIHVLENKIEDAFAEKMVELEAMEKLAAEEQAIKAIDEAVSLMEEEENVEIKQRALELTEHLEEEIDKKRESEKITSDINNAFEKIQRGNYNDAIYILKGPAEKGYLTAMYYYAIALEQKSIFKEAYYYAKMITDSGMGGESFQQKANELMERLENIVAEHISKMSKYEGMSVEEKVFVAKEFYDKKEYAGAFELMLECAEKGNMEAAHYCGSMYRTGDGVRKDVSKGIEWHEKAAEQGYVDAQYILGVAFNNGNKYIEKDRKRGMFWMRKAAGNGHEKALDYMKRKNNVIFEVAIALWKDEKYEEALEWLEVAAEYGNVDAMYNCGRMFEEGVGTEENREKADFWYEKAAKNGHPAAQYQYAWICIGQGKGGAEFFYWLEQSAENGNALAQKLCADFYASGKHVEKNVQKAVSLYEQAAEGGHIEAQVRLGNAFFAGNEFLQIEKDKEKAFYWLGKAAENGHTDSQFLYSQLFLEDGVENNPDKAEYWMQKARENDSELAKKVDEAREAEMEKAVKDIENGINLARRNQVDEALAILEKYAEVGVLLAIYEMAMAYARTSKLEEAYIWADKYQMHCKTDEDRNEHTKLIENIKALEKLILNAKQAVECFNQAVKMYNAKNFVEAKKQFEEAEKLGMISSKIYLAQMYEQGLGTELNEKEAFRRYKEAVVTLTDTQLGDSELFAISKLTEMYYMGKGVEKNLEEAFKWCQVLAEKGVPRSQYNLGIMYLQGEGTEKNLVEAFKWYKSAAEQGYIKAQYKLAVMYENGEGTEKNPVEAFEWYRSVVEKESGYENAQYRVTKIRDELLERGGAMRLSGNYAEAFKMYKPVAEYGNREAQFYLAWMYEFGQGTEENKEEALKWYRSAAEQGDASAQHNLALMYHDGEGTEQNYKEALKWYKSAADQNYADSQLNLALMYYNGEGTEQNYKEAFKWYKIAALYGQAIARNNLAVMYEKGEGTEKNPVEAFKWYEASAEQGYALAQNNLAVMYENGKGTEKNLIEAFKWYKMAAEQGYVDAQYNLAVMYNNGNGTQQNYKAALMWYKVAAEQGYASAQNNLGWMYENGHGTEKNLREALKWYKSAAEQGHELAQNNLALLYEKFEEEFKRYKSVAEQGDASVQFLLAEKYYKGEGTEKKLEEALKWYRAAAEQGNALAQYRLGGMYRKGEGTEKNLEEAFKWYKLAAEQGTVLAQCILALLYEYGEGTEKNLEEALKWYKLAAEQGNADAQYKLAVMYEKGEGTEKNLREAFKWYKSAAEQGNPSVQCLVAYMYLMGEGTERNKKEAIKWFKLAAEQGETSAQNQLNKLLS